MAATPDLLPVWVTVSWVIILASVLVFHCGHIIRMAGQNRWYHSTHVVMLTGMLYRLPSMEFGWKWIPEAVGIAIYTAVSAALIIWMLKRRAKGLPFSFLWLLAFAQQAAMVYMWMPTHLWISWLSFALVGYFGIETVAWLTGMCNDTKRGNTLGPGEKACFVPLNNGSFKGEMSIALMAASMGYMFLAMQLMQP